MINNREEEKDTQLNEQEEKMKEEAKENPNEANEVPKDEINKNELNKPTQNNENKKEEKKETLENKNESQEQKDKEKESAQIENKPSENESQKKEQNDGLNVINAIPKKENESRSQFNENIIQKKDKINNEIDINKMDVEEDQKQQDQSDLMELNVMEVDKALSGNEKAFILNNKSTGTSVKITKIDDNNEKYYSSIEANSFQYHGILNKKMQKNEFGYYRYQNNEEYIGEWKEDKKSGDGIYFYEISESDSFHVYIGQWEEGIRKGNGIYVYLEGQLDDNISEISSPSTILIGEFDKNNFAKGIKLITKGGNVDLYYGTFSEDGTLNDKDGIMIEGNKIFKGETEKDEIKNGIMAVLNNKPDEASQNNYIYKVTRVEEDSKEVTYEFEDAEEEKDSILNMLENYLKANSQAKIVEIFKSINEITENIKDNSSKENLDIRQLQELISFYKKYLDETFGVKLMNSA